MPFRRTLIILTMLIGILITACGSSGEDQTKAIESMAANDPLVAESREARAELRKSIEEAKLYLSDEAVSRLEKNEETEGGDAGDNDSSPGYDISIGSTDSNISGSNDEYSSDDIDLDLTDKNGEGFGDVNVDSSGDTVTIRLPALLVESKSQSELDETVRENGYISGKLNSDGSAEIKMDKSTYDSRLKEIEKNLRELLDELARDEDFTNFDSITADDTFTTVTVNCKSEPGIMDYMASTAIAMPMATYHVFKGDGLDGLKIKYVDTVSGEVYATQDTSALLEGD